MARLILLIMASLTFLLQGCAEKREVSSQSTADQASSSYRSDVEFVKQFTEIITLFDKENRSSIAISPALQGRVMTSTSSGWEGRSYGWINRQAFESRDTSEHMNPYGGEDRFWLGPEGGQFSIYFEKGREFNLENWHVPRLIDVEPFLTVRTTPSEAVFVRDGKLYNYSGTHFQFRINRTIKLLTNETLLDQLGVDASADISAVGYESLNTLKNTGAESWKKETGLLSIWILGMFNPAENATIIVPYRSNSGSIQDLLNDRYFGEVPEGRLKVKDNVIFFKADGKHRSKIGLKPEATTGWLGSYDPDASVLTLVHYTQKEGVRDYVNSLWEIQSDPYRGDAINAYNDGPSSPGEKPLGPFYELETSSPALALAPGDSAIHMHRTFHIQAEGVVLDAIMRRFLQTTHHEVMNGFN